MAKIATDLKQSKVLAKILPLESADMVLLHEESYETSDSKFDGLHQTLCVPFNKYDKSWRQKYKNISYFPCWSLAALLSIMPQINDWITPRGHKNDKLSQFEPKICKIWEHSIMPSYKVTYDNGLSTDIYDNPVNACYEMILKLHELNLL